MAHRRWWPGAAIARDVRGRLPWYADDWRAGLTTRVVAPSIFIFCCSALPALAFGQQLAVETRGTLVVADVLLATAVGGAAQALLGGQPLLIVGVAEPLVLLYATIYTFAAATPALGAELFLGFAAWVSVWAAALCALCAAAGGAVAFCRSFTRFCGELFGGLIALLFLTVGLRGVVSEFRAAPPAADAEAAAAAAGADEQLLLLVNGLWALVLALGTLLACLLVRGARGWRVGRGWLRALLADYGVPLALVAFAALSFAVHGLPGSSSSGSSSSGAQQVPRRVVTRDLPDAARRWGAAARDMRRVPAAYAAAAAIPGAIVALLFVFDHTVSSQLAQEPFELAKPPAYDYDLLLLALLTLLLGLLGAPLINGVIPQAPLHSRSLASVRHHKHHHSHRQQQAGDGEGGEDGGGGGGDARRGSMELRLRHHHHHQQAQLPPPSSSSPTRRLQQQEQQQYKHSGGGGGADVDGTGGSDAGGGSPTLPPPPQPPPLLLLPQAPAGGSTAALNTLPDSAAAAAAAAAVALANGPANGAGGDANHHPHHHHLHAVVLEQRVSNLAQALLCGALLAAPSAARALPTSVVWGYFLFLGLDSAAPASSQLFARAYLLLVDPKRRPALLSGGGGGGGDAHAAQQQQQQQQQQQHQYLRLVPWRVVQRFTLLQLALLAALYAFTAWAGVAALAFPVLIVLLVPLRRHVLPRLFAREHLAQLDHAAYEDAAPPTPPAPGRRAAARGLGDGDDEEAARGSGGSAARGSGSGANASGSGSSSGGSSSSDVDEQDDAERLSAEVQAWVRGGGSGGGGLS